MKTVFFIIFGITVFSINAWMLQEERNVFPYFLLCEAFISLWLYGATSL